MTPGTSTFHRLLRMKGYVTPYEYPYLHDPSVVSQLSDQLKKECLFTVIMTTPKGLSYLVSLDAYDRVEAIGQEVALIEQRETHPSVQMMTSREGRK